MLTAPFFADPDFLDLLRFWEASRNTRRLPDWNGDLGVIPRGMLPNLIVSDRRSEPTYLYVGAEVVRRIGHDPTGERAYGLLQGAHARYIHSLSTEALAHGAPVFSAAVYQPNPATLVMTGRVHAPFTYQGSAEPRMMFCVQLFKGVEGELHWRGDAFVHEIRRDLIAQVPTLYSRLEAARRSYQISRHTHQRTLVNDVDAIAEELAGSALVTLPCFEEPDPVADGA